VREKNKGGENMKDRKDISKYIPMYLEKHEMTVGAFASLIGASQSSVYNWIAGKPMM
jgi:predicted XRE-type DNA-binding protein